MRSNVTCVYQPETFFINVLILYEPPARNRLETRLNSGKGEKDELGGMRALPHDRQEEWWGQCRNSFPLSRLSSRKIGFSKETTILGQFPSFMKIN